jgi:hypothetical protein
MRVPLRVWTWTAAVVTASLTACVGRSAGPRPSVGPTTAPASVGTVELADAKPLSDLTPGDLQANLTDKLAPPQTKDATIYFGEVDEYDGPEEDAKLLSALPIIALKDGTAWKAVPVVGPGLANADWKYVGAGPAKREIWGVLDTAVGDGGSDLFLAHATDGGTTFQLFKLHKPAPQATVFDFAMSRDGKGRVIVSLDESVGHARPGTYYYETTDDGKTWSEHPRFEPDAMTRADSVPDDEQPDPAPDNGKPSKTSLRTRVAPPSSGRVASATLDGQHEKEGH